MRTTGIPTVGGEVNVTLYNGNILVNAMAVGLPTAAAFSGLVATGPEIQLSMLGRRPT